MKIGDQYACVDPQRLSEAKDVAERDVALPSFNRPEVGPVQSSVVSQRLEA